MSLPLLSSVLLLLAQAPEAHEAAPGEELAPRPLVGAVELRLPPGVDEKSLQALVAVQVGEPLTPRATQRTVRALYETGHFGNVRVYSEPLPGGARVRVVVECLAKRIVAEARVEVRGGGPGLSPASLEKLIALPPGSELYAGRVDAAVKTLRRALERRGYRQAEISAKVEGEKARVTLTVEPGPATRITSVALGPDVGLPAAELSRELATKRGAVLDLDAVEADAGAIRERLRKASYYRAHVGEPVVVATGTEATVSFPVEAGPKVGIRFAGDAPFPPERLRQQLGYDGEVPFDAAAIETAAERLRSFLASFGFNEARVSPEEVEGLRTVTVSFHVDAGRRYQRREVRFQGATFRSQEWLRRNLDEALAAQPPLAVPQPRADLDALAVMSGLPAPNPVPYLHSEATDVYREEAWSKALQDLVDDYRNQGFLEASAEVARVVLVVPYGFADIEVTVHEGTRTFVESVVFEGNVRFPPSDLARLSKLAPRDPLSLTRAAETRQAVLDLYFRKGFVYARVEASQELSSDKKKAVLRFRVDEGPEVHIAALVVRGNKRTKTSLIERTVGIRSGQVFDPTEAAAAQTELLRLGVFRSASLHLSEPEVPQATKDLVVEVEERPYQTVTATAGLSFAEGPRAGIEYDRPNVVGDAIDFSARLRANYPLEIFRPDLLVIPAQDRWEALAEAGFRFPRPFDARFLALRADLVGQHKVESAYLLSRGAFILGADFVRLGRLSASLAGQLEVDDVQSTTGCESSFCLGETPEVSRLLSPPGLTTLVSIQPRLSLDLRDNAVRPTFGLFAEATMDYSRSLGAPDTKVLLFLPGSENYVNLIKLQAVITTYLPLWTMVLALSAHWGEVFPLDSNSVTIAPKRFYLGGATTMRGYGENEMIPQDQRSAAEAQTARCASLLSGLGCSSQQQQLVSQGVLLPSEGGTAMLLFKAELRVPLTQITEAGFFVDWGNLWLDPAQMSFAKLRVNVGLGLRILTPVGPAAFDLGFNIDPDYLMNEPVLAPHFAVGFF